MDIWTYSPDTGELLPGNPRQAQLVWSRRHLPEANLARWSIPANATIVEPPEEQEGFARCFIEGAWEQVEDYRDTTVYLTADRMDEDENIVGLMGQQMVHTELGPLPEDVTTEAPLWDFAVWNDEVGDWDEDEEASREAMQRKVDAERDRRLAEGFADLVTGKTWACDDKSQVKWLAQGADAGLALALDTTPAPTFYGIATDNTILEFSAAEAHALFSGRIKPWIEALQIKGRQLKDQNPIPADFEDDSYWA